MGKSFLSYKNGAVKMMKNNYQDLITKHFFRIGGALLIIAFFVYVLSPFLLPFILGAILALAFSTFIAHFMRKGWSRKKAMWIMLGTWFLIGVVPVGLFCARGGRIISEFLANQSLKVLTYNIEVKIYTFLDHLAELYGAEPSMAREQFQVLIDKAGSFLIKILSSLLSQIPDLALTGLITLLSFYYFLSHEEKIREIFDRFSNISRPNADKFILILKSCCKEVFFTNVLTGLIQSSIVAFGALFCGLGDFYIIFMVTLFISFIPIIGAAPMAFLLAAYAFLDHQINSGIAMTVIAIISGVADNLIRPYLASFGEVEVSPFIGFLAVVGGVIVFGLPGLFLGPLSASLVHGLLPIIIDEYTPKAVHDEANY